ncbi:hypothetical protein BVRB_6g153830 [Beta vulgaris subsp. vulgaris]|uniref:ribonuclease 1 n=1 Tax=Beta vulgaris subsp. vulgaris TaxID=3555 RepID=UPI0005401AC9|nr:ribonuclease 1 [Beta vulgaris subsp. vulgaris]KMT07054.1 hypothetical protein BVRB_6g153830 [Beta vulgaris subsp. vulgaris]
MVKWVSSILLKLSLMLSLALVALANSGDFHLFYFVQQWLGSYCDQHAEKCCYPPSGKPPADFSIEGLWPYFNDGSFPYNCGGGNFNEALLKPMQDSLRREWPSFTCPQIGRKFWVHEWNKHGTCSKTVLGEVAYFQAALNLKNKVRLLQALGNAGIRPNNQLYSLKAVKEAIARGTGFHPWVVCNKNSQGISQIWQVAMCVDRTGTRLINCPFVPKGQGDCKSQIKFPAFY